MNSRPLLATSTLAVAIACALLAPAPALAQAAPEPPASATQQDKDENAQSGTQTTPPQADAREMDSIEVKGQRTTHDYSVQSTSSATKLDLALKETPQSVTVFTEQLIQDMDIRDVHGMVTATPGASTTAYGIPGTGAYRMMARGFNIDNFSVDGIRINEALLGGASGAAIQDSFLYERVDLIRGSTGLTSGFGNPSASVNFIRKRPTANPQGQLNLKYGSWDSKRIEADYSGPLNASGSWRGRVAAAADEGGFWIDRASQNGYMLYGITELDVGNGMFTLGASQQYKRFDELSPHGIKTLTRARIGGPTASEFCGEGIRSCYFEYTLADNGIGKNFNNATEWTYIWYKMTNAFAGYRHAFDNGWELVANYNFGTNRMEQEYGAIGVNGYAAALPFDRASLTSGFGDNDYKANAFDTYLKGRFDLFGREQTFVVGVDGYRSVQEVSANSIFMRLMSSCGPQYYDNNRDGINDFITGLGSLCSISVSDWHSGNHSQKHELHDQIKNADGGVIRHNRKEWGAYFALQLRPLEHLQVIAGGRFAELEQNRVYHPWSFTYGDPNPKGFVPYGGLIYELTPQINAYVSYTGMSSTSHFSERAIAKDGGYLPPIEGDTWEGGIKAGFHDDRLNLALSYFNMTQRNYPTVEYKGYYKVPDDFVLTPWGTMDLPAVPGKGHTVEGVELNVAGELTPRWKINAGYVYQSQHGPVYDLSQALAGSANWATYNELVWNGFLFPRRQFKLFTSYQLTDALTLGAAVNWQDTVRAWDATAAALKDTIAPVLTQEAYTVVSAMARYKVSDQLMLGLNVGNLFDKEYFTNRNGSFYGAPRSWSLSVNYRF